jgi:hypothetical protein
MDPDTFPASVESESLRVELASDTTTVEPEAQEPKKPVVRRENTPSPPSTQPPPETVEPPRVDVSVKMSEEEREQLEREAHGRIIETNKILGSLDSSAFSQAKLDALLTIKGLIKSASDALEQGDVQAADSLARKALLLATDLAPK